MDTPVNLTIDTALFDALRKIAKAAGVEIIKIYNTDFDVERKSDKSPVTEADQIAEKLIIRELRKNVSESIPIVGEESVAEGNIPDISGGVFWLVDALDGTREFINRRDEFTVNIALIENGTPVLGIIHVPVLGSTYWGSNLGAFAETAEGAIRPIRARPAPKNGLVAVASKSHRSPETDEYLTQFKISQITSAGSSLKFCLIASGEADIYPRLGRTMEWDTAAGHAILHFAGGEVTDLNGHILSYGKNEFENPFFVARGRVNIQT